VVVYLSAPMVYQEELYNKAWKEFGDSVDFYRPKYQGKDPPDIAVYSDLKAISKSDVIICYMPEPSIGTTAEITYSFYSFPDKPIIGYRCINHPWLKHFLSSNVTNMKDVKHLIEILKLEEK